MRGSHMFATQPFGPMMGARVLLRRLGQGTPPEISIQEWTATRDAEGAAWEAANRSYLMSLRNIVVMPDNQRRFMQSCGFPDKTNSAVSSPVDAAALATKTCEEAWAWKCQNEQHLIDDPNPACPGQPLSLEPTPTDEAVPEPSDWTGICDEMTGDEWTAVLAEKQAAWEAAGKSTLDEACAIVNGEFRQYCWYPNGNRGQTSGTSVTPDRYISCEDNWAHICSIPEAEGGAQGSPACQPALACPEGGTFDLYDAETGQHIASDVAQADLPPGAEIVAADDPRCGPAPAPPPQEPSGGPIVPPPPSTPATIPAQPMTSPTTQPNPFETCGQGVVGQ